MIDNLHKIADVVLGIEVEMRRLDLWQDEPPSPEALASHQPFCFDTLSFSQWLQWVFLPRMKRILERGGQLPAESGIFPLAEECLRGLEPDGTYLLSLIRRFDDLIAENRRVVSRP